MSDILGKIFSYILMTFALFIAVMSLLSGIDRVMDSYIMNKTTSFVDVCRTTGRIDPNNYEMFCDSVYRIGKYDIEICHRKRIALWVDGKSEVTYKDFYDEEILSKMYEESETENFPYILNNGDHIKVTIRKENNGFSGGFYDFFLNNSNQSTLLVNYSGVVGSNGL